MKTTGMVVIMLLCAAAAMAENVDPYDSGEQYGWSENTGWLNAEPGVGGGMQVAADRVTGWVWGENIGWINLHCANNDTCKDVSFGVVNDGRGNLSGFAWGENIGWIHFDGKQQWSVRVCIVTLEDLANFAADWLEFGTPPANLNGDRQVDMEDFSLFSQEWLDYCPDGWQLK